MPDKTWDVVIIRGDPDPHNSNATSPSECECQPSVEDHPVLGVVVRHKQINPEDSRAVRH